MIIGGLAFIAYLLSIPLANWLIGNVGTACFPDGPCVVPVWPWPLIYCPSGSLVIGLALVLRDLVQRALGKYVALIAIAAGVALSCLVAPPALVLASGTAFAISELADFAVYTPLYRRRFLLAVAASSIVGLVVDSIIFLWLAFGSLELLAGLVIGKLWMVLLALPFMRIVRDHFDRNQYDPSWRDPSAFRARWIR